MASRRQLEARPGAYHGREQTLVKHLVLRQYLERVAWNVLSRQPSFVFVDGFSGPWKSREPSYSDTSFGIAINELRKVREALTDMGKPRDLRCIFVEKGKSAFEKLAVATASASDLQAKPLHGRLEDHVDEIMRSVGAGFSLTFIDPTGWSFDLQRLGPLLRHRPGEVLVNFMFEHFNRFLDDKRPDIQRSQVLPFGDPQWRERLAELIAGGLAREEAVLELFRRQLRSVGQFEYVLSTRIRHRLAEKSHFYLVYGTRHPKGLIEFRDVEKKAMQAEEYFRAEAKEDATVARTGQLSFLTTAGMPPPTTAGLRQAGIDRAREWLRARLGTDQRMAYAAVLAGVLERFPVTKPELGDLLVDMSRHGELHFLGMGLRQRKPDDGVTIAGGRASM